ncbi:MAG: hypothetical protein ACI9CV_001114 [Ilumatobacter sp.]|jgi:hypothetical protein
MNTKNGPAHVVVDGSNLATEGRSLPSLQQLNEAVMSFMEENPDTEITVVVDATFGHRIDKKETQEFEEGISNNELVAPPAGAVGRGDAFVLGIANKANSTVLSNDSFQEFHGQYDWLFDEGRLIGGKPVPHVGWVWVERTPVRGPVSRKATRGSGSSSGGRARGGRARTKQDENQARVGSVEANAPMPVPKGPPPASKKAAARPAEPKAVVKAALSGGDPVNELLPFLEFVEHHPVGTSINGTVDAYSSHGAYITIADTGVRGYVPLRMMAAPTPRSAKSIMKIDSSVTLVVVSFNGARRSIDCAVPDMAARAMAETAAEAVAANEATADVTLEQQASGKKKSVAKTSVAKKSAAKKKVPTKKKAPTKQAAAKKATTKKVVAQKVPAKQAAAKKAAAKKATTRKVVAKKVVEKEVVAKEAVAKKMVAHRTPAKKAPAKKVAASVKTVPPRAAPAKKIAAATAPAKRTPAKQIVGKKIVGKKIAAKKIVAKKIAAKNAPAKNAPAKKVPAKKIAAKKATTKKAAAKQSAAKKET